MFEGLSVKQFQNFTFAKSSTVITETLPDHVNQAQLHVRIELRVILTQ